MRSKSMHKWMSCEMERLSLKWERYKPIDSGYNRIQPILLSKSVAHMLNNPLPVEDQIGNTNTCPSRAGAPKDKGVLSITESEWEEVYPTVQFTRNNTNNNNNNSNNKNCYENGKETKKKFAYYRNCSTRITS